MKKLTLLGGLTPTQFFRDYWYKKPLLIRQAIPDFKPLLSRQELFTLARQKNVESQLLTHFEQRYQLQNGPIDAVPDIRRKDWTLLVQSVNLHHDAVDALLRQFRFVPDARLDDLIISYATDTGGIGPHIDPHGVFLLQAHGQHRWRIGVQKDLAIMEGQPLKILRDFQPEQEFVLAPGDMLYLPPNYAHEGIALGESMTYSIGFRAPAYQELGEAFLQFMADSIELPGKYADPDLKPTTRPAEISRSMLLGISAELNKVRFTEDDITLFLGSYLSEPKASVTFAPPARPLSAEKFIKAAVERGITLSRKTQMLYRGKHIFINGESFSATRTDKTTLDLLADGRALGGKQIATTSADVQEALHLWYQDGWLNLT